MWPPQRRSGQVLGGKYRVEELLALGGMGMVYSGRHELTRRPVAIKLLRPELAARPDLLRRVTAEARLAVEASHPNVVEVLDAGADEFGTPYLILERLYGKSLESLLGERLTLLTAARALVPVMNALAALHGAGIVHRDIKPSNIFLSLEGGRLSPKLLDFGIAKAVSAGESSDSSLAFGTPAYMAPEQALGHGALGPAADVWSMGVVLVRCLSGRLPFEAGPAEVSSLLRSGLRPNQWQHVPERIGAVLVRALQLDPCERFPSMAEFRSVLLEALRQADARESWPNDITASYALSELRADDPLVVHLAGTTSEHGDADDRPVRPHDVPTRTQSKLVQETSKRGWPRVAVAASVALALASAAAIAVSSRSEGMLGQPAEPSAAIGAASLDEPELTRAPDEPEVVQVQRVTPERPPQEIEEAKSSVPLSPSALETPAQPLGEARQSPPAAPTASNRARGTPAPGASREPELGPNRAPIIE